MTHRYQITSAGFPGNNSRDLLAKVDQAVLAHHPKLVVMMVGSNDVLNSGNSIPIEEYRSNIESIVKKILAAGAKLALMTTLPCYAPYVIERHKKEFFVEKSPATRVAEVVAIIRDVAAQYSLPVVDLNTLFEQVGQIGELPESLIRNQANCGVKDGVHPTPEGYRMIAMAVHQSIINYDLPREQIVCFGDSITFGQYVKGEGTTDGDTYPAALKMLLSCGHGHCGA